MATREENLKCATLWQIASARDAARAVKFVKLAENHKGKRRDELLSDAAMFQLLSADSHRLAVLALDAANR